MPLNELLLREFDSEMAKTRKTLERVPAEHWDWKPDPKSGSFGWMASHVATLPGFVTGTLSSNEIDIASPNNDFPKVKSAAELLPVFDKLVSIARELLSKATEAQLAETWTLRQGDKVIFALPRYDVLRGMCLNHLVHHRGQLTTYLRAHHIPVPALYGPSGDEQAF